MKKIIIVLVLIGLVVTVGITSFKVATDITRAKIIQEIEVDGVDEVDKGIVTLKIDGQYYDYEYEYKEGFKSLQDRIDNGEDVSNWAEIIK